MTVATVVSPTQFTVVSALPSNLIEGSNVFNRTTMEQAVVASVSGTTINLIAPGFVSTLHLP